MMRQLFGEQRQLLTGLINGFNIVFLCTQQKGYNFVEIINENIDADLSCRHKDKPNDCMLPEA